MGKRLSEAQIEAFRRDGFLFPLDGISPAEAADCVARIEAYERTAGEDVSRSIRVRAYLAFPWIVRIARTPAIADVLQDLMGPDVMIYLSAVWSKPPGAGKYVSWHQDGAYYAFDRHDGVTAWVALSDATPEMGCLHVLPGSHRAPPRPHDETFDSDNLLSRGQAIRDVDEDRAVAMALAAGQFSVHHEMTVHGSGPNRGAGRRIGISLSCVPAAARPLAGPRSAFLLAGENRPGHWALDPEPRFDLDPVAMAALARAQAAYRDPDRPSEAERGGSGPAPR